MIIDAHLHHLPLAVYEALCDPGGSVRSRIRDAEFAFQTVLHDVDGAVLAMDAAGVDGRAKQLAVEPRRSRSLSAG